MFLQLRTLGLIESSLGSFIMAVGVQGSNEIGELQWGRTIGDGYILEMEDHLFPPTKPVRQDLSLTDHEINVYPASRDHRRLAAL